MKLRIFYDNGKPFSIQLNRGSEDNPMWASLPFDPRQKTFTPQSEMEQQLLTEAQKEPEWPLDLSDCPPAPIPPPPPDWQSFRRAILKDKAYQRVVSNSIDQRAVTRLELFAAIESESWIEVQSAWNIAIAATPAIKITLTATEITTWNQLAARSAMPFTFISAGTTTGNMVLKL